MKKYALLIGVCTYEEGLEPIPSAANDVRELASVLRADDVGAFTEVTELINPKKQELEDAIEALFRKGAREDLLLMYYSGHGVRTAFNELFLTAADSRMGAYGLVESRATNSTWIHPRMDRAAARRQILILDACFSGAFVAGLRVKAGPVDARVHFGGMGRAVLTSSASHEHAIHRVSANGLSAYTYHIVRGISTGEADLNHDGRISAMELHEYARRCVTAEFPELMTPEIHPGEEGHSIVICQAATRDPVEAYRARVRAAVRDGEVSATQRQILHELRQRLGLPEEQAIAIESAILAPFRKKRENLEKFRAHVANILSQRELEGHTRLELDEYRLILEIERFEADEILHECMKAANKDPASVGLARMHPVAAAREPEPEPEELSGAAPLEELRREFRSLPAQLVHFVSAVQPRILLALGGAAALVVLVLVIKCGTSGEPTPAPADRPKPPADAPVEEPREQPAPRPPGAWDVTTTQGRWAVRISADSSFAEAQANAERVRRESEYYPQIVKGEKLYYILVGAYSSRHEARQQREVAKTILGEGALICDLPVWCPSPNVTSFGYAVCGPEFNGGGWACSRE